MYVQRAKEKHELHSLGYCKCSEVCDLKQYHLPPRVIDAERKLTVPETGTSIKETERTEAGTSLDDEELATTKESLDDCAYLH